MPTLLYQASDREWAIFQSWNNICILFHKHPLDVVYANFKPKKTTPWPFSVIPWSVCVHQTFSEITLPLAIYHRNTLLLCKAGRAISYPFPRYMSSSSPMMSTSICAQTIHTVLYLHKGNCQGSFTTMIGILGFHVGNESHNAYLSEHLACITYISPD